MGEATARSKNQHRFYSDSTYTHIARIYKGLLAVSEERATQEKDVNRPYRKITPNEVCSYQWLATDNQVLEST